MNLKRFLKRILLSACQSFFREVGFLDKRLKTTLF